MPHIVEIKEIKKYTRQVVRPRFSRAEILVRERMNEKEETGSKEPEAQHRINPHITMNTLTVVQLLKDVVHQIQHVVHDHKSQEEVRKMRSDHNAVKEQKPVAEVRGQNKNQPEELTTMPAPDPLDGARNDR